MFSFQNKRLEKLNEIQIKMAKIQHIKNKYEQRKIINLANTLKRMNKPEVSEKSPVVSEKSLLQNYISSDRN
jgi:hypothetical protein